MSDVGADQRLAAEQRARVLIDRQLAAAGWDVQDKRDLNLFRAQGVAVRESVMAPGHGRADYFLYVDKSAVGVIEAKPEGTPLSGVEWQSAMYAEGLPAEVRLKALTVGGRLPFVFEASGTETHFTNGYDPEPRARKVFAFPKPSTFARILREQLLPSGRQRAIDNRVGWALTYLFQAGLTERPQRAHVRITDLGRQALVDHPDRIDMKVLEGFPAYVEFRDRNRNREATADAAAPAAESAATPQDLLDRAVKENRAVVESELLQRALALPPVGFEDLVMKLLAAMGYGHSGRVERTSAAGDAGIDGIISQDPLGLDRIYVQAKRYQTDKVIHRPTIQAFVGALMGAQGDRGVFITTSSFSAGARLEAERSTLVSSSSTDPSRPADGAARVGVQPESIVTVYQLDEDFFEVL